MERKILIDFRRLQDKTGISSYLIMILKAISCTKNTWYLLVNKNSAKGFDFAKYNVNNNIEFIYCNAEPFSLKANIEIPFLIQKNKIDVFHSTHFDIPLGIKFTSCKLITTIHDIIPIKYSKLYKQNLFKKMYFKFMFNACSILADKILTVSEYSKQDIISELKINDEKISVIYNSYDIKKEKEINAQKMTMPYKLFFIGTNFKHKNIHVVIEALKILRDKNIDVIFNIAGAPRDYTEILKNKIEELKLDKYVKIWGKIDDATLLELYSNSNCYVFPSLVEGFGIPLLEAMSHGLPIISSNKTVMPEIVGNAGLLIEPTAENFAEKIEYLINNPEIEKKFILEGYERIKMFSQEKFNNKILEFYTKV